MVGMYPDGCTDTDIDEYFGTDVYTIDAKPSILWENLEHASYWMRQSCGITDELYFRAKIRHISEVLMQQSFNA